MRAGGRFLLIMAERIPGQWQHALKTEGPGPRGIS
jgi:hypothetical protein